MSKRITYEDMTGNSYDEEEILEALVDRLTLSHVLGVLADVAEAKAEHIHTNWQDRVAARPWERAATDLLSLSNRVDV